MCQHPPRAQLETGGTGGPSGGTRLGVLCRLWGAGDGLIWAGSAPGAAAAGLTAGRLSRGLGEGARGGAATRSPLKAPPAQRRSSPPSVTAWPHSPPQQLTSGVFPLPASPLPGLPSRPRGLSPEGPPLHHAPPGPALGLLGGQREEGRLGAPIPEGGRVAPSGVGGPQSAGSEAPVPCPQRHFFFTCSRAWLL